MENLIRILSIFSTSGPLAVMWIALLLAIVVLVIVRRIIRLQEREVDTKAAENDLRLKDLEFKVSKQIEHKPQGGE